MTGVKVLAVPAIPFALLYGGAETCAVKTTEALRNLGWDVSFMHWEDGSRFDLLHLFGLYYWHSPLVDLAKGKGIPVVCTTLSYVPPSVRHTMRSWFRRLFTRLVPIPTTHSLSKKMVDQADMLLANSQAEVEYLVKDFGANRAKIKVLPNSVDERFSQGTPEQFRQTYGIEGEFALCVGKIEPRKNQLALAEAFSGWDKQLILLGDAIDNVRSYFDQVMAVVKRSPNIRHISHLPHGSGLLASAYAAAKVHVLLGVNETPGVVSLEAALAGASLAVLECPPVREYLVEFAEYIPDLGVESVRRGIAKAWGKPASPELKKRILGNYLWKHTAELTAEAYDLVLRGRRGA